MLSPSVPGVSHAGWVNAPLVSVVIFRVRKSKNGGKERTRVKTLISILLRRNKEGSTRRTIPCNLNSATHFWVDDRFQNKKGSGEPRPLESKDKDYGLYNGRIESYGIRAVQPPVRPSPNRQAPTTTALAAGSPTSHVGCPKPLGLSGLKPPSSTKS